VTLIIDQREYHEGLNGQRDAMPCRPKKRSIPACPGIDGSPPPLLAAPATVGAGDLGPTLGSVIGCLKLGFDQPALKFMVAMMILRKSRIRFSRLLVHLIGGDLACGVEEGRKSSCRCSHGVMDFVLSIGFVYVSVV
jgi:hypothetical protein